MSDLDTETTADVRTFEHFGRQWSVPTKQRLSHIRRMRDEMRAGTPNLDLMLAEIFLSREEFDALCEIDPDRDELDAFGNEISKALGLQSSGNSASSASSS